MKSTISAAMVLAVTASASLFADAKVGFLELKHGDDSARNQYFAGKIRIWSNNAYKTSPEQYNALLSLSNSRKNYAFHIFGKMSNGIPRDIQIGMLRPSAVNWYAGGFLKIISPKNNLFSEKFTIRKLENNPQNAGFELIFTSKALKGTLRFELAQDDDFIKISFIPSAANLGYETRLIAYPGTYGDPQKIKRCCVTNTGSSTSILNLTQKDRWIILADKYYDASENRGDGCCAILLQAPVLSNSKIVCSNNCTVKLQYAAGQTMIVKVGDFKGWSLRQAEEYMKKFNSK